MVIKSIFDIKISSKVFLTRKTSVFQIKRYDFYPFCSRASLHIRTPKYLF
ncbi:hypothetical protein X975_03525, partial [Stegodyphus mimosarum]